MVQLKNQPFCEQPRDYGWINIRPCSLDNPCPDFLSAKAPTGKVFQADTQTTAVPHMFTEGLWFNLLRRQICRLTLNMLHSSLSRELSDAGVHKSASCSLLLSWCCSQKMLYHSRNNSKNVLPLQKHLHLMSKPCGFLPLWVSRVTHINNTWLRSTTQSRYLIY